MCMENPTSYVDEDQPGTTLRALIDRANNAYRYWNYKEAYTLYKEVEKRAKKPIGHVTYRLALMSWGGHYVPVDKENANLYFSLAHEQLKEDVANGNPEALCDAGYMYEKGLGTNLDGSMATKLYKQAADQGNFIGLYNYAVMLRDGVGVPQDLNEAMKYFHLSSDNDGPAWALFHLGFIYQKGFITKKDENMAMNYFCRAAAQPEAVRAQIHVASIYEKGKHAKKDYKLAIKYWFLAYSYNHEIFQKTVLENLRNIFSGARGDDYLKIALDYLSEKWPHTHAVLEETCQISILEIFFLFRHSIPLELLLLLVKELIIVWPNFHFQKG